MALRDNGHLDRTLNLEAKKRRVAELRATRDDRTDGLLVELLRDESWFVRDLAAAAVTERGRRLSGEVLGVLGSGLWYSRAIAATVLGRMGAIDAAPPVAALLLDANRTVREAAYDALIALAAAGGERSVAAGVRKLDSAARARFMDATRQRHPAIALRIGDAIGEPPREPLAGDRVLEPVRT